MKPEGPDYNTGMRLKYYLYSKFFFLVTSLIFKIANKTGVRNSLSQKIFLLN